MENKELNNTEPLQAEEKETIIDVKNVSMEFFLPDQKVDNLKEWFIRFLKGKMEKKKHKVLDNVSFSVKKGESIALIGHNGAGKSTLLKILTGIIKPTEGSVMVKGVVAPLLNLGAGFDNEASARENVYLNGAILGYSRREIEHKYKEIVDFADLHDYMNMPLKNFSSGMVARLGFAIAIDVNPDILLVDEILSVGDENFRRKCSAKIEELRNKGVTFVIVSHNMGQVKNLCQKAVWIEDSHMRAYGDAKEVCDQYIKYCNEMKR